MSIEESLDVTRIYSVADQLPASTPLIKRRPFCSPYYTISHAGLVGGGNIPKRGEISLAHRGVLVLDEFPEFGTSVLEVMRQPMEDKVVTISFRKLPIDCRDEPVSVWMAWKSIQSAPLRARNGNQISKADLRFIT